ncbi:hypothetical protein TI39_contig412g00012 [Zymoseptoria brevis]|uniref:BTB domain-containing protein n=1 Tax=Zymoseptoria brevis TaxID=1047168 RepID=A0A0F4GLV1_9PEZI|nr:hypothetical protein TI39_contig412g00012 [Zymoseptoria brevis]
MEAVDTLAIGFIDDELISIELEDGGIFKVQRAALCHASEYFCVALRGNFQEANSKKLRLPDCTTVSFKLILFWIFNCKLPDLSAHHQLTLAKLWTTGDMLLMRGLQNEAMRHLRTILLSYTVDIKAITWAFDFTPLESPLRRAAERCLGSIPGLMQALFAVGKREILNDHYHMKIAITRDEDSKFEFRPLAKDN